PARCSWGTPPEDGETAEAALERHCSSSVPPARAAARDGRRAAGAAPARRAGRLPAAAADVIASRPAGRTVPTLHRRNARHGERLTLEVHPAHRAEESE